MLSEEQTAAGSTTQKSRQTVLWDGDGGLCQRAWVEIDLAALTHNVKQLKHLLSPNTELMAVVKADAYGHGAIAVSQTALQAGASWLGVATIPEGIELREAGIEAPILLLGATNTPAQVKAIAQWHLQPTICTAKQALIFSEVLVSLNQSLPVHAKLDTGMSRLGTSWQDATEFVQLVNGLPNFSPDRAVMREQQQRFKKAIAQIQAAGINPCRLHLANSAAALTDPDLHYDLVRAGLATYGLYPAPHLQAIASLQPAMQVKARVTQVKTIAAGTGVSYGYKFIAGRETQIAVVGIGYADGIPRNLSTKMQVLVRGKFVPQVGAVTMDQLMLDVTDIPDLEVGEVVTLLGNDGENKITADDWAEILGTISWEILCGFKHRLPRVTVNC
ncbi:MAG: alanine racemase [Oscillatoriales cyanobacterium]|nr:MAG: alanine racemase [Oscillatoriales cyanobacterium]